jgi:hypothetical protein
LHPNAEEDCATISTGGTNRADELAYDTKDQLLVVANDADATPFFTFIDTVKPMILGKLLYPNTTNGIEQPAWSPTTGLFYVSIPQSKANPGGKIAVLDPKTQTLKTVFPLPSNYIPRGLTLGPHPNALVGCGTQAAASPTLPAGTQSITAILDITTGKTTTITNVGGSDEVWYNPGDNRYYSCPWGDCPSVPRDPRRQPEARHGVSRTGAAHGAAEFGHEIFTCPGLS